MGVLIPNVQGLRTVLRQRFVRLGGQPDEGVRPVPGRTRRRGVSTVRGRTRTVRVRHSWCSVRCETGAGALLGRLLPSRWSAGVA
jgi:hypothetical protein